MAWMVRTWLCFALVLGCAPEREISVGADTAAIINGTRETGYPQVVAVVNTGVTGSGGLCSGTVIGPYAVLTAKHCVFNERADGTYVAVRASEFLVVVGHDLDGAAGITATSSVYEIRTTPGSNINADVEGGNDIAILLLPASIGVSPVFGTAASGPAVGTPVSIVGFGRTMAGTPIEGDSGTKYRGSTSVSRAGMRLFETMGRSWTCQGDSGGPALDSMNRVVGITSFGPGGCTFSNSYFTRVAAHTALIADALRFVPPCEPATEVCNGMDDDCDGMRDEGCSELGTPCTTAAECEGGRCEDVGGGMIVCTRDCDPTTSIPRCPFGFHCQEQGCGTGRCVEGEPGVVPDGEPCSTDLECASARCVNVAGAMRCARACTVEGDACATSELLCEADGSGCGSCIPVELATGPRPFGAPCESPADCASGACLEGACSRACTTAMPCPGGWHCRGGMCVRGDLGSPGDDCVTEEDCGAVAPECVDAGGEHLCASGCAADGTCELGFVCMPTDAGDRCVPPGLPLGEPCAAGTECRSGLCATVCTRVCTVADPCPTDFTCEDAGGVNACVPPGGLGPPPGGSEGRDSGGCSISGSRHSTQAVSLLLLVLLIVARRRAQTRNHRHARWRTSK